MGCGCLERGILYLRVFNVCNRICYLCFYLYVRMERPWNVPGQVGQDLEEPEIGEGVPAHGGMD